MRLCESAPDDDDKSNPNWVYIPPRTRLLQALILGTSWFMTNSHDFGTVDSNISEFSRIPFGDLRREEAEIGAEVADAVRRVLGRGWYILGSEGEAFECEFARALDLGSVAGCANGTDAIALSLRALGLGPGDRVVTVANTCVPTAAGIRAAGCELGLVDCDPITLQMAPEFLERTLTGNTRAVVAVHLFGASPDLRAIAEVCERAGISLVEDCAQAHGTKVDGKTAGNFGTVAAWSFYPSKNLGAYGDGGAVSSHDPDVIDRVRSLRNYGQSTRYLSVVEGVNSRLDEIQAAILRVKLPYLAKWNARRNAIAAQYDAAIKSLPVQSIAAGVWSSSSHHLYPIRIPDGRRDSVRSQLEARGIGTQIHYPVPLHQQPAFCDRYGSGAFPNADLACREVLSLPMFPQLSDQDVDAVCRVLREVLA